MKKETVEIFYPKNKKAWRQWLEENHASKKTIWLICYKKSANKDTIIWGDAVDEALCFGWIDSTVRPIDDEKYMRSFMKRKPNGTWSKINKEKIELLIASGKMTNAGLECIEKAKQNGSWEILDEVEELIIPKELEEAFKTKPGSKDFFISLSRSVRKAMLHRIALAKRPETKQKRIVEIIEAAGLNKKPKQF
ncbi:MAG TPA: YdeI/OmpD-associated family protein [Cytophaga sp.]|nr:YdeI/OmpD-associated family protein [Cytophaga sp.]